METIQKIALVPTIIGALNWALIGLFNFNLVTNIFGVESVLTHVIYVLIGICGAINIGLLFMHIKSEV